MKWLWRIFSLITLIVLLVSVRNLSFIFEEKTQYTSSKNLPPEIRQYIEEFVTEARKYNRDISKLDSLKYVIIDNNSDVGGYYDFLTHTIFINKGHSQVATRGLLWHELGHAIFNYGHDASDRTLIMNGHGIAPGKSWEQQKKDFFERTYDRNYLKNSVVGINLWVIQPLVSYRNKISLYFATFWNNSKKQSVVKSDSK